MKLADWARRQGVDYKTAYRWFRAGILPCPSRQLPTGTILVDTLADKPKGVSIYARVSSSDQKEDLDRQVARLSTFAASSGLIVDGVITDIGSGLNGRRSKLIKFLSAKDGGSLIVEHRDRLARFGFEYIEAALASAGRKVIVLDDAEVKDDLVRDMVDVLTSFCARLYGRRSARNKALKAVEAIR